MPSQVATADIKNTSDVVVAAIHYNQEKQIFYGRAKFKLCCCCGCCVSLFLERRPGIERKSSSLIDLFLQTLATPQKKSKVGLL